MSNGSIEVEHDPEADAVYVRFAPPADVRARRVRTRRIGTGRFVDEAADGAVLGVEFLDASDGVDLTGVPRAEEVVRLLRQNGIRVTVSAH